MLVKLFTNGKELGGLNTDNFESILERAFNENNISGDEIAIYKMVGVVKKHRSGPVFQPMK